MRQIIPVLLSLFFVACSGSASSHDPNTPPDGCKRTMCDLVRSNCTNPSSPDYCMECLDTCTGPLSTSDCSECTDMCTTAPSPTPDYCGQNLDSCRKTTTNAICVDGIEDTPAGAPPCNDVAGRASCASSDNEAAQDAIYEANPACKACDDGWVDACT
jgi:hypothetical protein